MILVFKAILPKEQTRYAHYTPPYSSDEEEDEEVERFSSASIEGYVDLFKNEDHAKYAESFLDNPDLLFQNLLPLAAQRTRKKQPVSNCF